MSNAKKKDAPRQDRRKRALARLTVRKQNPDESAAEYVKYLDRKDIERDARIRHLGAA